jgi:hypothetical protein
MIEPTAAFWLGVAMVACHSGPAARSVRSSAKNTPSLLTAPTMDLSVPPMVAVNKVGVPPKSASPADCSAVGTVHHVTRLRSLALSFTMDGA